MIWFLFSIQHIYVNRYVCAFDRIFTDACLNYEFLELGFAYTYALNPMGGFVRVCEQIYVRFSTLCDAIRVPHDVLCGNENCFGPHYKYVCFWYAYRLVGLAVYSNIAHRFIHAWLRW